jgi:hypothetical protein
MPTASASEGRALVERERFPESLSPTVCKAAGSSARALAGHSTRDGRRLTCLLLGWIGHEVRHAASCLVHSGYGKDGRR